MRRARLLCLQREAGRRWRLEMGGGRRLRPQLLADELPSLALELQHGDCLIELLFVAAAVGCD